MEQYALITGAVGGIGQALCEKFSNSGFTVIATDNAEQPEKLICDYFLQLDLAQAVTEKKYADEVLAEIKNIVSPHGLQVLVNNAAIQILGGIESLTRNDWGQTLNVNLLAPFFLIQSLLPELEKTGAGSIINISSIHARLTKKNFVAYATSKAALSNLTKVLSIDLGPRLRINGIEPAAIETEMLKSGFVGKEKLYQDLKEYHPQKRIGTPLEVASLALSMVDGDLKFLHGAVVPLDGGISNCLHDPD